MTTVHPAFYDFDDDEPWYQPLPDGARHAMPGEDGLVPCCGLRSEALPDGDWMTAGPERVTCNGGAVQ